MTYRSNIGEEVKVGNNTDTIFSVDDRFTDKDTGRNMYYLTIKNKKGSLLEVPESSLRWAEDYNPNKTEPVNHLKAFMDTTYGTINFEHPKLQQYLIEQWAADKKMVALAKQVNEEKETK